MSNDAECRRKRYAEDPEYRKKKLEQRHAWVRANRDEINTRGRERYANDAVYREKKRASRRKHRHKHKRAQVCRSHGLSVEEFEAMFAQQQGACAICRRPFRTTPCIDHCYLTGWVRGLLCHGCNRGLGHYGDNPAFLAQASTYMQRWVEHLIVCFTKENKKMSKEDTSEQSNAAQLIRHAILKELKQPFGAAAALPVDRLEAVARALIDKAEERDLEAIKEVFDRAGGKTQSTLLEAPRLLNVTWQRPPPKPRGRPKSSASTTTDTSNASPAS